MSDLFHVLQTIDKRLFFWLNVSLANGFFDLMMPIISNKKVWYLPGGILWLYLMWKGGREGRILGVLVIFAIVLADQISSSVLKPLTARLRPCKVLEGFRLLSHCGSRYGFPSSHASNIAAVGSLFIYVYRKWSSFWVALIFLIGFSRIYLGVHYPFDVIGGWALGAGIGWLMTYLHRILNKEAPAPASPE